MYLNILYIATIIVSLLTGQISTATLSDPDVKHETSFINSITGDHKSTVEDPIKQVMHKECLGSYTPFCMKLSLMNMIGRIGIINLPILPGITLRSSGLPPASSSVQRLLKQPDLVDNLLMERLSDYLGTLSLNVKILENEENGEGGAAGDNATGRKKDKGGGAILAAGMMSAGTVLAVKLAALAAISGKALMAAMIALMLAAIAALTKGGGEDHKTTYEIVAKPVVSHSHTHSSEIQHGHSGHYKRSLDAHDLAYAKQKP